jgi:hypothetical protein
MAPPGATVTAAPAPASSPLSHIERSYPTLFSSGKKANARPRRTSTNNPDTVRAPSQRPRLRRSQFLRRSRRFDVSPPPSLLLIRSRPYSKDLVTQFQNASLTCNTDTTLPREVIQYVEDGRNPDIYTREFVELVAKSNQLMNGKRRAFRRFRDVLAEQIEAGFPELTEEVRKVQENTGGR